MSASCRLPLIVAEHRDLGRGVAHDVFLFDLSRERPIALLDD